jgi:heme ABC exporter ATP-binding subunit CcmA
VIEIRGLVKSFGGHFALRQIDLDVAPGECLALVGPNGAGKTTLLRVLAALSRPSSGSVHLGGVNLADGVAEVRKRIGFLSHQPLLYGDLSAEENLRFYGRMYDVANLGQRSTEMLEQVGLKRYRTELVRTFSRGMKQRLAIARAFLHDPPVLLLDEPYTGLDRQAAEMLDTVLRGVGLSSRTVLLATHSLERGLSVSDRVVVLVQGRIACEMGKESGDLETLRVAYDRLTKDERQPR